MDGPEMPLNNHCLAAHLGVKGSDFVNWQSFEFVPMVA